MEAARASRKLRPCRGGQLTHQAEAARDQIVRQHAGHLHHRPHPPPIGGRRRAHAVREEITEASEARESNLHADIGHGVVSHREQRLRAIETRLNPELMRRQTEHRLEEPDEVKRRDLYFAGHRVDRERTIVHLLQEVARANQPPEDLMSQ
jgi:hypothetical protein